MRLHENYFPIQVDDVPFEVYHRHQLDHKIQIPSFDQYLWVSKCQMAKIYGVTDKVIETSISRLLKSFNQSEADYSTYFQIIRFGNHKTRFKFYRIDLVLLVGRTLGNGGYNGFKSWMKENFGIS